MDQASRLIAKNWHTQEWYEARRRDWILAMLEAVEAGQLSETAMRRMLPPSDPSESFTHVINFFASGHDALAVKLYKERIAQGQAAAMCNLAYNYLHGEGVARDTPQAAHWFRQAAAKGYKYAEPYAKWMAIYEDLRKDAPAPTGAVAGAAPPAVVPEWTWPARSLPSFAAAGHRLDAPDVSIFPAAAVARKLRLDGWYYSGAGNQYMKFAADKSVVRVSLISSDLAEAEIGSSAASFVPAVFRGSDPLTGGDLKFTVWNRLGISIEYQGSVGVDTLTLKLRSRRPGRQSRLHIPATIRGAVRPRCLLPPTSNRCTKRPTSRPARSSGPRPEVTPRGRRKQQCGGPVRPGAARPVQRRVAAGHSAGNPVVHQVRRTGLPPRTGPPW